MMPSIGVVSAYLELAYNLYLAHNQKLEERLVRRLKQPDQFLPAYYETSVFGALIRTGFELEFEDETDSSTTHCEVTATFRKSGKKFSVEAKMRQASTASLDIGRQIKKAAMDALELYDFFYDGHKSASKDNLLKLLNGASDMKELKKLSREDLLQTYCERLTTGFFQTAVPVE
jgi:hypothetical protein